MSAPWIVLLAPAVSSALPHPLHLASVALSIGLCNVLIPVLVLFVGRGQGGLRHTLRQWFALDRSAGTVLGLLSVAPLLLMSRPPGDLDSFESASWEEACILVLVVPLFEEIKYRGVILELLLHESRLLPRTALLIGGLIFGLAHIPWDRGLDGVGIGLAVSHAIVGILCCSLYWESGGSIWLPFGMHAGLNAVPYLGQGLAPLAPWGVWVERGGVLLILVLTLLLLRRTIRRLQAAIAVELTGA